MTARDILELSPESKSSLGWMREIAYQLALLNGIKTEAPAPIVVESVPLALPARKRK